MQLVLPIPQEKSKEIESERHIIQRNITILKDKEYNKWVLKYE